MRSEDTNPSATRRPLRPAILLVVLYGLVIGRGHPPAPVGIIFFIPDLDPPFSNARILGVIGIAAVLVARSFRSPLAYALVVTAAPSLLLSSLCTMNARRDVVMWPTAVPFFVAAASLVVRAWLQYAHDRDTRRDAAEPPGR